MNAASADMDDGHGDIRSTGKLGSRCGGRSRKRCARTSPRPVASRAPACRPRRNCRPASVSIATPCAARWKNCPATGWCGSSKVAAASWPRTCWTTPSEPRTRFSEWIRKHNKEPSGRVLQLREIAADPRRRRPGLAFAPAAAWCCWSGWDFADDRAGQSGAALFPGLPAARDSRGPGRLRRAITEALRAVGVDDYLRQQTRVTARAADRRPRPSCCAWRATGRCWSPRTSTSIVPERWSNSATGCYPTPRVQIVFEP